MATQIEEYQKTIKEYEAAKRSCEKYSDIISRVNTKMINWRNTYVINTEFEFPDEISNSRNAVVDANEWPSGQTIARALSLYHEKKSNMMKAYSAIPASQKEVILKPPV